MSVPSGLVCFDLAAGPVPGATPDVVGTKAYGLLQLARAGLRVPPGFVLGTEVCRRYFTDDERLPDRLDELLGRGLADLERATRSVFGGARHPLLLAVRSGAPFSMPGMMATVLNVGLTDRSLRGMIRATGNPRVAWDSYRRFLEDYGEAVCEIPAALFRDRVSAELLARGAPVEAELDVAALRSLCQSFLELVEVRSGAPFPQDPMVQLRGAIEAVLRSWRSAPAVAYRRLHSLDDDVGTAVTIQAMVFGNLSGRSGSGVAFTRDPATGEDRLYLDFMANAQGEDVVAGRHAGGQGAAELTALFPRTREELECVRRDLERIFEDAQDFEFTVQDGVLYLLQTRTAKRTPWAALRIAVDLAEAGLITRETALQRLSAYDLSSIELTRLSGMDPSAALDRAVPASPGVAVGRAALDAESAQQLAAGGQPVVLLRHEAATADLAGMAVAAGILTAVGSRTSHAAVVARHLGKVCLVGCAGLRFDWERRRFQLGGQWLSEGDYLSLDGNEGAVYQGRLPVRRERPEAELAKVAAWQSESGVAAGDPAATPAGDPRCGSRRAHHSTPGSGGPPGRAGPGAFPSSLAAP